MRRRPRVRKPQNGKVVTQSMRWLPPSISCTSRPIDVNEPIVTWLYRRGR